MDYKWERPQKKYKIISVFSKKSLLNSRKWVIIVIVLCRTYFRWNHVSGFYSGATDFEKLTQLYTITATRAIRKGGSCCIYMPLFWQSWKITRRLGVYRCYIRLVPGWGCGWQNVNGHEKRYPLFVWDSRYLFVLVGHLGLEPKTDRLWAGGSNQLS